MKLPSMFEQSSNNIMCLLISHHHGNILTVISSQVFANNSDGNGPVAKVTQTTWPLPPVPEIIMATNTSLRIHIPLGEIYEPLINLSLIVSILYIQLLFN